MILNAETDGKATQWHLRKNVFSLGKNEALGGNVQLIVQKERCLLHPSDVFCMQTSSALMTVTWSGCFHL